MQSLWINIRRFVKERLESSNLLEFMYVLKPKHILMDHMFFSHFLNAIMKRLTGVLDYVQRILVNVLLYAQELIGAEPISIMLIVLTRRNAHSFF